MPLPLQCSCGKLSTQAATHSVWNRSGTLPLTMWTWPADMPNARGGTYVGSVASFRLRPFVVWSLSPTHAAKEERDDGDQLQRGSFPSRHYSETSWSRTIEE